MKKSFMAKFKLFLTILLALTMAFTLLSSVACKDKPDDSTSSDSTQTIKELTDTQLIKNGDFEYGTANKKITEYPVYSSVNWARANGSIGSSSAPSSSNTSGIIDTREWVYEYDEDGYVKFDKDNNPIKATETDTDGNKKEIQLYQGIARNKAGQLPELKNADGTTLKDANGNTVYYNPRTPSYYALTDYTGEEGALSGGGKILMINNKYSEESGKGTAQYFSASSEFSLYPGQTGKIELWLMTKDLKNPLNNLSDSRTEFGAFIEITTTLGSIATPATRLKHIDTKGEWAKFTFYIDGSNFAQTKLSLKVGLGEGNAMIMTNFVEGYAFIDDVAFTVLEKDETVPTTDFSYALYNSDGSMAVGDDGNKTSYFDKNFKAENFTILPNAVEAYQAKFGEYNFKKAGYEARTDYTEISAYVDCKKPYTNTVPFELEQTPNELDNAHSKIAGSVNTDYTFGKQTTDTPFGNTEVYTINAAKPANLSYESDNFFLNEDQYIKISFWVKTNFTTNGEGISLYLVDKGNDPATVKEVETAIVEKFTTKKDSNSDYDDWTKFTVVVSNTAKDASGAVAKRFFSIKMVVGPKATSEDIFAFPVGNVSITNVSVLDMVKNDDLDEVGSIEKTQDTRVKEVALSADLNTVNTETETTDTYTFSYGKNVYDISKAPVNEVINYVGVVGNHNRVGVENGKTNSTQAGTIAGLINTEYLNNYGLTADEVEAIEKLKASSLEDSKNKEIQPLIIKHTQNGLSYGYIGSNSTISANSTALITVKVKVLGNSIAYIYLVDGKNNANFDVLDVSVNRQELIGSTYGDDAKRFKDKDTTEQYVNGKYQFALSAEDTLGDEFTTVAFLIKTGDKAIDFRVEMWNGIRKDSNETKVENSQIGTVIFGDYSFATSVDYDKQTLEFKQMFGIEEYENATEQTFTRIPSKVLTDAHPEDGEVRVYTEDKDTAIAFKYGDKFIVSDLSTIYIENELDEITVEEEEDTPEDTEEKEETSYNPFLYFTSLAVTFALIVALLAVVVKHVISAIKKRKSRSMSYYDRDLREKAIENIKKSKETKFKEEYDYDNIESNIIEETEEVEAETEETETEVEDAPVEEATETVETTETAEPVEVENKDE